MRYASGSAFRNALEERLRKLSLETDTPLSRLRKTVAFDRLLARLEVGAPGVWALKGGLALQVRLDERSRTTKDVDLHTSETAAAAVDVLAQCAVGDLGDFFEFRVAQPAGLGVPIRCAVEARLDGRRFETFHVDIAVDELMVGSPTRMPVTSLLEFADIPIVAFPCLPLGQHVAEKVHALVRERRSGDSTRVKDLIDLVLIAETCAVDACDARMALAAVFSGFKLAVPVALPRAPVAWRPQYRRMAEDLGLRASSLDEGVAAAADFVGPLMDGTATGTWCPDASEWH